MRLLLGELLPLFGLLILLPRVRLALVGRVLLLFGIAFLFVQQLLQDLRIVGRVFGVQLFIRVFFCAGRAGIRFLLAGLTLRGAPLARLFAVPLFGPRLSRALFALAFLASPLFA